MNYVTEVANLFLARSPHISILSPMDYTLIAEWEKEEIPLAVVLQSINEGCDEAKDTSKIESISYFEDKIRNSFTKWLQSNS